MIILGFSGFEDIDPAAAREFPASAASTREDPFAFRPGFVPMQSFPLGTLGHDPAAALLSDGGLVAAAAEERFTRLKHGFNLAGRTMLPRRAMRFCLDQAGLDWKDVDYFAHYCRFTAEGVAARAERVGRRLPAPERALLAAEHALAYRNRLSEDVVLTHLAACAGRSLAPERLLRVPHHLAHAAGAFYSSGFDSALCLTLDGYGEEESATWALARPGAIEPRGALLLPSSMGTLYQVITSFLGFRSFGDEYKVMGLSAYGDPQAYSAAFEQLVELGDGGACSTPGLCRVDLAAWLREAFGEISQPGRLCRRNADIAAGLQRALESAALHVAGALRRSTGARRLCVSGGVGLNACMNGALVRSRLFEQVFVQPAAGDDGAALGAALYAHHDLLRGARAGPVRHVYWGPEFGAGAIEAALAAEPAVRWERSADVAARAAEVIAAGGIVGWFQGRMEIGPRALGARSILASPASAVIRDRINALVKGREPFRPFAPSVVAEEAGTFFDIPEPTAAPYMIVTYPTYEHVRRRLAGVVHVDGSVRVQTVCEQENPVYYRLLRELQARTGLPVVLNTSFNRAGEPIVCRPEDAIRCFLRSRLDALAIGDYVAYPADAPGGNGGFS
jgi:carbamoyltransferase